MSAGILVANLGSPDAPSTEPVERYLCEFLMDPHVISLPSPLRSILVRRLIAPRRAPNSARAYRKIWMDHGSPLVVLSGRLADALASATGLPVSLGMRYGSPSLRSALERLDDCDEVLVVPLYPHYALPTRQTLYEALDSLDGTGKVRVLRPFYDDSEFVELLAGRVRDQLDESTDHLLFSFHGLPHRSIRLADPTKRHCLSRSSCCDDPSPAHEFCYRHQCYATARAVAATLNVAWSVSFQSRLGRLPWLTPYTDVRLRELAERGARRVVVTSPSFMVDNLETLEELAITGVERFKRYGGEELRVVPCLNAHARLVALLERWLKNPSEWFEELTSMQSPRGRE